MLLIYLPCMDGRQSWSEHHECKYLAQGYYCSALTLIIERAASL